MRRLLMAVTAMALICGAGSQALAQEVEPTPSASPTARAAPPVRAGAVAKPGYVTPPENSGGLYPINGEPIFKSKCAGCHDPAIDRAPTREELGGKAAEEVYDALTIGSMKQIAAGMSEAELYGLVRYVTGKSPIPNQVTPPDPNICAKHGPLQPNGPQWNGWSTDNANLRYQDKPGFTAAQVPKLKVKWAFSYVGTKNTAPLVFGDRIFVGSMSGKVYSLDAGTGCVHWRHDYRGGGRASMVIGKNSAAKSGYALYMGDDREFIHAFDAQSGEKLWDVQVDDHKVGRITGSLMLHHDLLYAPLSASEESQGNVASYNCCTFLGTVVAVDVKTGKVKWKQAVTDVKPQPTRKNSAGTQMYGPAGAAIWSAVTIDAKRGQLYAATGDSYTEVNLPESDAIVAMDLKTGKIKWVNQVLANDNFMSGSINAPLGPRGPDYDFGSSPMLMKMSNGKDILVTGNKSAIVYGMDPDTGKTIWESAKLGSGGASGGNLWGTASDGKIVYVPLNDAPGRGKPGMVALNVDTGKEIWRYDNKAAEVCGVPSGRCGAGMSPSPTAIPGVVFQGDGSGILRAFAAADGKVIWQADTTTPIDTVNGVKGAYGGTMAMAGPSIAGGTMYVHSGYQGSAGANNLLLAYSVDGK